MKGRTLMLWSVPTLARADRRASRLGPMVGLASFLLAACASDSGSNDSTDKNGGQSGTRQTSGTGGSNGTGGSGGTGGSSGSSSSGGNGQNSGSGGTDSNGSGGDGQNQGSGGQGSSGGSGGASATPDGGKIDASTGSGGAKSDGGAEAGPPAFTAPECLNGKKDGMETGVDCGGSCPACPNYKINGPNRNNNTKSACDGGGGYMCARSMVFSPEFKQAAMDDWNSPDPPFVYGAVGHDPDNGGVDGGGSTCCQCYQLVFESPVGVTGLPIPKPMIVQAFNTQAGGAKAFDVYMAVGGYGANNGCFGGGSAMYSAFPDVGGNYAGGVKATRYGQCASNGYTLASVSSSTCQSYVSSQCNLIKQSSQATQTTSINSCLETNFPDQHYHVNWNVRAKRVECPTNLTRVTGCKLNGSNLPKADPAAQTVATADSSFKSGYHTTTMQDCCRPTCAYGSNVSNSDSGYSVFYTCDKSGNPQ